MCSSSCEKVGERKSINRVLGLNDFPTEYSIVRRSIEPRSDCLVLRVRSHRSGIVARTHSPHRSRRHSFKVAGLYVGLAQDEGKGKGEGEGEAEEEGEGAGM